MKMGAWVVVLLCAMAGVARADNKELAKQEYNEGKRHFDLGEWPEALAAFKKAYLNYGEPVFLFNIALCYRQLGDRASAARELRAFLDNWPKAPNRVNVERMIAELRAADAAPPASVASPPVATTSTTSAPPPPKVASAAPVSAPPVNATPNASTPSAPAVNAPASAPPPVVASASVVPRATPTPAAERPVTTTPAKRAADFTEMVEVTPDFDRPHGAPRPGLRWWGWTLIAVAVVGVAAAAVAVPLSERTSFHGSLPPFTATTSSLHIAVRF